MVNAEKIELYFKELEKQCNKKKGKHVEVIEKQTKVEPDMIGSNRAVRKPTFPYIPSADICGVVEAIDGTSSEFKVGDCVLSTWGDVVFPQGGAAEYTLVDKRFTIKKPKGMTATQAAAAANSCVNAMLVVRDANVTTGSRVLILGGGGGIGTHVIQLARHAGASFIAATSTNPALMSSLGVDRTIDYTTENWWAMPEFTGEGRFDTIIDAAEGLAGWEHAKDSGVLKSQTEGGLYLAVLSLDSPRMEILSFPSLLGLLAGTFFRHHHSKRRKSETPVWKAYWSKINL